MTPCVDHRCWPDIRLAFPAKLSKIHIAAVPWRRVRSVDRVRPACSRLGFPAILVAGCLVGADLSDLPMAGMAVDRGDSSRLSLAIQSRSAHSKDGDDRT